MLKEQKGVTLLELMVALVITALLGLAIYNVCKMAMDAWQKGEARTQVYQNARIALDRMSEEIRSAITLNPDYNSGKYIYFNGTATQLDFIATAYAPTGNYYDSWAGGDPNDLKFDCCEIGYSQSGTTIYRRQQISGVPDSTSITSGGSEKEMATHITNLAFRYSPDVVANLSTPWLSATTESSGLPKLVEIVITAESESTRFPNEKTFSTYVYLPQ